MSADDERGALAGAAQADLPTVVDAVIRDVAGFAVDPDAGFFEAGLGSAQVVRICTRLAGLLGREIPISAPFKHPSPRAFAAYLAAAPAEPPPTAAVSRPRTVKAADARRELRTWIRQGKG